MSSKKNWYDVLGDLVKTVLKEIFGKDGKR